MKTTKTTLRMETLEERNMPSASPLGAIAAPAPTVEMLDSGRVRVSTPAGTGTYMKYELENAWVTSAYDDGSTAVVKLENVFVSGVQGDPTPKIALRWEQLTVPVVEESGASSGGIVSEGQGYGFLAVEEGTEAGMGGGHSGGRVQQQDIHFLHDGSTAYDHKLGGGTYNPQQAQTIDAVFSGMGGETAKGQKTAGYDLKAAKKV